MHAPRRSRRAGPPQGTVRRNCGIASLVIATAFLVLGIALSLSTTAGRFWCVPIRLGEGATGSSVRRGGASTTGCPRPHVTAALAVRSPRPDRPHSTRTRSPPPQGPCHHVSRTAHSGGAVFATAASHRGDDSAREIVCVE